MKKIKVPYETSKAAESAANYINELIIKIADIPTDVLGYCDCIAIGKYLGDYRDMLRASAEEDE